LKDDSRKKAGEAKSKKLPKLKELADQARKLARRYRVEDGDRFRLSDAGPGRHGLAQIRGQARRQGSVAAGRRGPRGAPGPALRAGPVGGSPDLQAMDAAGKDGAIKHVMSGINPQGCQVVSFKAPSPEDLDHDFLWRCSRNLPERGRIGIFNRSYYEEVLVVRVHEALLAKQKLPSELVSKDIWSERFKDIRAYERYLENNGTLVRKFFLHVSRKEQKRRFLERIDNPEKNWKFSATDAQERGYWKDYMRAYEDMIQNTATKRSPWYVVPADNKWFTRIVVAAAVIEALDSVRLKYPDVGKEKLAELARVKKALEAEK
jgi:PPK2 family polyphosphate:nucleotide phosphotransferase